MLKIQNIGVSVEGAWPGVVGRPGGGASALGIHGDRTRPAPAAAMAMPFGAAPAAKKKKKNSKYK